MTINKWYDFNKEALCICDCVIKVLKNGSRSNDDTMLPETLVKIDNAVKMFGEYEIIKHGLGVGSVPYSDPEDGSYHCLRFVLWAPENK